jgi:tRNA 2-thiouridine synthesizing protein A
MSDGMVACPDAVLDTLGLRCPVPVIRTSRKIKEVREGGVLEVLSDDPLIVIDLQAWCFSNGQEFLGSETRDGRIRLQVKRLS